MGGPSYIVIYTHALIHVCVYICMCVRMYMCVYAYVYTCTVCTVLHALPLPSSFYHLPLDPSSVIHAGKWLWQLRWLVLPLSPMDKMHVMQQGPTEHVRANPEMKGDFQNISFLLFFLFFFL